MAALLERVQNPADFPVPDDDLREVFRELLAGTRGVGEIVRQRERGGIEALRAADGPGGVRFVERGDKEERFGGVAAHERLDLARVKFRKRGTLAGIRDARNLLELERFGRTHVLLARKADSIAEFGQIVNDGPGSGPGSRMVPTRTAPERVEARVEFGAARIAHGHRKVRVVEGQSFGRELVDPRGLDVRAAVEREIVVGDVVGDDDQEVRRTRAADSGQRREQDQRQQEFRDAHGSRSYSLPDRRIAAISTPMSWQVGLLLGGLPQAQFRTALLQPLRRNQLLGSLLDPLSQGGTG